jgi:hypothetical protein
MALKLQTHFVHHQSLELLMLEQPILQIWQTFQLVLMKQLLPQTFVKLHGQQTAVFKLLARNSVPILSIT